MPPTQSVIQRSFAGGELAPALHARADLARYATGLRTCKNFFVRKEGGVSNRAGFQFIKEVADSTKEVILMRYIGADLGDSVLIEMGDGYFRFYHNGDAVALSGVDAWDSGTDYVPGDIVVEGGANYYCIKDNTNQSPPNATYWYAMPDALLEIPHGFGQHKPNWDQQGQLLALTHGEVAPADLIYQGLTRWVLRPVSTAPWSTAPTGLAWTPGTPGPSGGHTFAYVVTAARLDTYEETEGCAAVIEFGVGLPTDVLPNALTWDALDGAAEYYVYCDPFANGVYGYIGTAASNSFNDTGFVPDFNVTPPIARVLFNAANEYPNCSGTFEQRRVFASTGDTPDQVDLSRTGFDSNFGIASPVQDDDAIRFRLAGSSQHPVHWAVGAETLMLGTSSGVWRVGGGGSTLSGLEPITPSTIEARQAIFNGTSDKKPTLVGRSLVYIGARQKIIREAHFDVQAGGLDGRDLTVFATHLFEPSTLYHIDYAESLHSICWVIRNDGLLLGLTYLPEEQMFAWHQHDTRHGAFEDVCVVQESDEDAVYVVVKRNIDGNDVRYIERMASRLIDDFNEDCFFVDSGLSYHGSPTNTFSGLDHLIGEVVAVVGDGAVLYNGDPDGDQAADFTIAGDGTLALAGSSTYSDVHIGLAIRFADIETLDLDVNGAEIRDHKKRVGSVTLLVDKTSRGFSAGPDADHLSRDVSNAWDGSATEFTGEIEIPMSETFNPYGRVFVRQTEPLPITILGIIPNVEVGG